MKETSEMLVFVSIDWIELLTQSWIWDCGQALLSKQIEYYAMSRFC